MTEAPIRSTDNDDGRAAPVEWRVTDDLVDYEAALKAMRDRVAAIQAGEAGEQVWLLQHPPLYTAGTSAQPGDLLAPDRFPVHRAGRGGQYTYHGPGQRIAYVMLDLNRRKRDVRAHVWRLEEWVIRALGQFNLAAGRREGRIGLWVDRGGGREDKIAAIGVRISRWVTFHGLAVNVEPDLEHFAGIVPCGISGPDYGVTSLVDLGYLVTTAEFDAALMATFDGVFGKSGEVGDR